MKDGTGKEFNDELTSFLEWYLKTGFRALYVPYSNFIHFYEGIHGLTIYRDEPYQVQLFTVEPNTVIPIHTHPNVDSYEVSLSGMELILNDKVALPRWQANLPDPTNDLPLSRYGVVRVLPDYPHGGSAGKNGGTFMSVQRWLNGVKPTSVAHDWGGETTLGKSHDTQITSTKENG